MIILYHTHILITASSHHVALLRLDYIWETACEIVVIVPLFIRLISCWKTPQNVGNSLSELQEIQNFQTPLEACSFGGRLGCLTILITA
jgi:hypothetical protein